MMSILYVSLVFLGLYVAILMKSGRSRASIGPSLGYRISYFAPFLLSLFIYVGHQFGASFYQSFSSSY